ncbi:MAG: NYN domain-containing protein [Alphaproteobacteria bacterium]|nr:NYN domain-containing protein [Alphaproteobacteria bacterium]
MLVDADNIGVDLVGRALQSFGAKGDFIVRRAYGALGEGAKATELQKLGLTPIHCVPVCKSSGGNAADIALVIDALDLLHRGGFDGFVIGSSDSDFTPLARRIREAGLAAYGFGDPVKCTKAYRAAFTKFYANLPSVRSATVAPPATASPAR